MFERWRDEVAEFSAWSKERDVEESDSLPVCDLDQGYVVLDAVPGGGLRFPFHVEAEDLVV